MCVRDLYAFFWTKGKLEKSWCVYIPDFVDELANKKSKCCPISTNGGFLEPQNPPESAHVNFILKKQSDLIEKWVFLSAGHASSNIWSEGKSTKEWQVLKKVESFK